MKVDSRFGCFRCALWSVSILVLRHIGLHLIRFPPGGWMCLRHPLSSWRWYHSDHEFLYSDTLLEIYSCFNYWHWWIIVWTLQGWLGFWVVKKRMDLILIQLPHWLQSDHSCLDIDSKHFCFSSQQLNLYSLWNNLKLLFISSSWTPFQFHSSYKIDFRSIVS